MTEKQTQEALDAAEARALIEELISRSEMTGTTQNYTPHEPTEKQRAFLDCESREALYGGAAGGGKSDALLMGALEYVHIPGYAALLLRRTHKQLTGEGGLIPRSHEWLAGTDAVWREGDSKWYFPSGATLSFGHCQYENDKFNYQSHEYQFIGFDELTQFRKTMYTYIGMTRCRRPSDESDKPELAKVPLRTRGATNPGGIGHVWVKERFVDKDTAGTRGFFPAFLEDNPYLDQESYDADLNELDTTTYLQLRKGKWVRDTGGLVYKYHEATNLCEPFLNGKHGLPVGPHWTFALGVDLGASESKPTTAFVVIAFSRTVPNTVYVVWAEKHKAMIPSTIAERIRELETQFLGFQSIVVDHGGLGKGYIGEFNQRWRIPAIPALKTDKLGLRKLINGDFEKGVIQVIKYACDELVDELESLPWNEAGTDNEEKAPNHLSDALLYTWRQSQHWFAREPHKRPDPGTPEYAAWEEEEMRKRRAMEMKDKIDRRTGRRRRSQRPQRHNWRGNLHSMYGRKR